MQLEALDRIVGSSCPISVSWLRAAASRDGPRGRPAGPFSRVGWADRRVFRPNDRSPTQPARPSPAVQIDRSFGLEVTRWAPTRLTSCIFHPGPEEASGASTLEPGPAQPPFRLQSSPESARKPLLHTRGICRGQKLRLGGDALGADPTYLLYLPFRSRGELRRIDLSAWPRTATLRLKLSLESTHKPPVCNCGISRSKASTWR